MMNNRKNNLKNVNAMFIAAAAFALLVSGCSLSSEQESAETQEITETSEIPSDEETTELTASLNDTESDIPAETAAIAPVVNLIPENVPFTTDISNLFTERDLRTDYEITESIDLNTITDSVLNITQEGVFELSGKFDGQVRINCDGGKVQLVLNNADITCTTGSAIYVENAKKVFITLAEDSESHVTGADLAEDTESAAAIYSSSDLTINGLGTLLVIGFDGIVSKDDLVMTGGVIIVVSEGNGIRGKDSIAIYDMDLEIESGGDGLKSNSTDEGKGFIYIQNGEILIDADEDGIQAESELIITDGTINITSGGGTANAVEKHDDMGFGGGMMGGRGGWDFQNSDSVDSTEDSVSIKGMKAGSMLYISGGAISLNTADDALHSNGSLYIQGGNLEIAAGDKGIHADANAEISGGFLNITQSYEGIEATDILVSGGTVKLYASDDGFNASDGSSQGARGGAVNCSLTISGGEVYVNAGGDGLDSNGTLTISGGTVFVDGPENSGNGALDSNNGITCSGGTLIAVGSSGMAEYPDNASQPVLVITLDSYQNADTRITLRDENGKAAIDYTPSKRFDSVIVSRAELQSGKTYTLFLNNTEEYDSVTLNDSISFIGEPKGMGMMGGHGGGKFNGQMPDMPTPPDENDEFNRSQFKGGRGFNPAGREQQIG